MSNKNPVTEKKGKDMSNKNPVTEMSRELIKWQDIKAQINSGDIDEQCLLDTLEGATNLYEMLLEIEESVADHDTMAQAIDLRIKQLQTRKDRAVKSAETLRTIIMAAMDRAGIKTIKGNFATLTIKPTPQKATVIDESKIPSDFFVVPDPKLDKKKLLDALKDGQEIEGCELSNGGITLQIRRG